MANYAVEPFEKRHTEEWDAFVRMVGAPFLFQRGYMGYHADRFPDASLIVRNGSAIVALLPATSMGTTVSSHRGLTYGGFMYDDGLRTDNVLGLFAAVNYHYRERGFEEVEYKALPHIYHAYPREADLYCLFRWGGRLEVRNLSSTVCLRTRRPFSELRRRGARKAAKAGVRVLETMDLVPFWSVLEAQLSARHNARPVHSVGEITYLRDRFPENIRLYTADLDGECLGGCIVYDLGLVAHAQYIASSAHGRSKGALDLLFAELMSLYHERGATYFDFGTSNEDHGRVLNEGLIFQKEGFGARGVVYDTYRYGLVENGTHA